MPKTAKHKRITVLLLLFVGWVVAGCDGFDFSPQQSGTSGISGVYGGGGKVAVLIPQTGAYAVIGKNMQNAVLMAYNRTPERGDLQVVFYDTQGTGQGAALAAQRAVNEGADMIMGPLLRTSIDAVRANVAGLPILSFSNDVAKAGPNTYIMGISSYDVTKRVIDYAQRQNNRRVAIFAPNEGYGQLVDSLPYSTRRKQTSTSL